MSIEINELIRTAEAMTPPQATTPAPPQVPGLEALSTVWECKPCRVKTTMVFTKEEIEEAWNYVHNASREEHDGLKRAFNAEQPVIAKWFEVSAPEQYFDSDILSELGREQAVLSLWTLFHNYCPNMPMVSVMEFGVQMGAANEIALSSLTKSVMAVFRELSMRDCPDEEVQGVKVADINDDVFSEAEKYCHLYEVLLSEALAAQSLHNRLELLQRVRNGNLTATAQIQRI